MFVGLWAHSSNTEKDLSNNHHNTFSFYKYTQTKMLKLFFNNEPVLSNAQKGFQFTILFTVSESVFVKSHGLMSCYIKFEKKKYGELQIFSGKKNSNDALGEASQIGYNSEINVAEFFICTPFHTLVLALNFNCWCGTDQTLACRKQEYSQLYHTYWSVLKRGDFDT